MLLSLVLAKWPARCPNVELQATHSLFLGGVVKRASCMAPLCVRACACVCVFTLAEWRPRLSFAGADGYLECMRDQLQEVYAPFTPPCSPLYAPLQPCYSAFHKASNGETWYLLKISRTFG